MSIITFWNGTKEQCGSTSSSIAFATQMAMDHNTKTLVVSTSLNDPLVKDCFWTQKKKKSVGFFGSSAMPRNYVERNGVEGLDRIIRSNKITPNIITDYTEIVLTNRLEVLLGMEGSGEQYDFMKARYAQIISVANQYYDTVIVDLDKRFGVNQEEILKMSDVVVAVIPQREREINKVVQKVNTNNGINKEKVIYSIGKYVAYTKYNVKNITRNFIKQKEPINTIPYNSLFFEASQEGKVVDLFMNLMQINSRDENADFVSEIRRLIETIDIKKQMLQIR